MKLEKQLTNLKLSKKLKELGVKQESNYRWVRNISSPNYLARDGKWLLVDGCEPNSWEDLKADTGGYSTKKEYEEYLSGFVSAFTVAELGEMLRKIYTKNGQKIYIKSSSERIRQLALRLRDRWATKNEVEDRAKMLIYLIENNFIKARGQLGY